MARITWDSVGSRTYEYGVDRGVLYVGSANYGVAWNGLINVNSSSNSVDPETYYLDGFKYYAHTLAQDFSASIEAYTYPDQFNRCEGYAEDEHGLGYDTQRQESFGLSYRTKVGNDTDGTGHAYKIHIIYNALAKPSERSHETLGDDLEPTTFSWDLTTTPIATPNRFPTAHFVLDSRKIKSDTLEYVESVLYGSIGVTPRLPEPSELITIISDWSGFRIIPRASGVADLSTSGVDDLSGDQNDGIFTKSPGSRLSTTSVPGVYRLE